MDIKNYCNCNCNFKSTDNGFMLDVTSSDKTQAQALKNLAEGFAKLNCCGCNSDRFERCNCSDC